VARKEEVEHLLRRSKQFLETAEYQISKGFYDLAVFSLEQALQLFLKSKMLASGADYPRTHSVRALLEILSDLAPEDKKPSIKHMLNRHLLELGILEDAYITSRYVMRGFKREEAERLVKVVEEVMKNVT
jgi:HEPN domain-containing protein